MAAHRRGSSGDRCGFTQITSGKRGETWSVAAAREAGSQFLESKGKLVGQKLNFEVHPDGGTIHFELIFDGETIKGDARMQGRDGERASAKLNLKRTD
ncbi:MAG: hypothetical protein HYS04_20255 [Acidobacteria bacterium]|nr:hypothetical protein [Acidobacteriota bacterium]